MPILYDLPRINEHGDFGQKGPTCWYYASKMLLKFHEKLEKKESNEIYKQMKTLHGLRKALTEIEEKARRDDSKSVSKELAATIREHEIKLSPYYYEQYPVGSLYRAHLKKIFDHLNSGVGPYLEQIKEAKKVLDGIEGDGMARLTLLTNFVPDAGFAVVGTKEDVYGSPTALEEALRAYGPMYTGGELTRTTYSPTNKTVGTKQDDLIAVTGLKPNSGHVCVIAGVNGKTVYYKDPNYTHKLFSAPFDTFQGAIDEAPITLKCGASPGNCSHAKSKQLQPPS